MSRIGAVLFKELTELGQNPGVFVPALLTGATALCLPFFVAIVVPFLAGERLADSSDFEVALELYHSSPQLGGLSAEGAIQAWVFQQFVLVLILAPVAASMSVAAFSVIGEKQGRSLEPLLATPITTAELLTAKVLGAAVPAVALTVGLFLVYVLAVELLAEPGVWLALLSTRTLVIVFLLGPLATLVSLQLTVCVSSRVNDARSAQQIGALVVLPIAALLVAQLTGTLRLTTTAIGVIAAALAVINVALARLGVALFDRETVLTRWK